MEKKEDGEREDMRLTEVKQEQSIQVTNHIKYEELVSRILPHSLHGHLSNSHSPLVSLSNFLRECSAY